MQGNVSYDVFFEPAVKLFCRQLKDCQSPEPEVPTVSEGAEQIKKTNRKWLIPLKSSVTGKEVLYPVSTVWLQGNILSIVNETHLILKDLSGGIAKINYKDAVAGGSDWINRGINNIFHAQNVFNIYLIICLGVYCSVIGNILSSTQTPQIQAVKMNKLDNVHLETLWEWEVKDLANELVDNM